MSFPSITYVHMFSISQLFAANQNKPPDIVNILVANKSKLLRLFADFKTDKGKDAASLKCNSWPGSCHPVFTFEFVLLQRIKSLRRTKLKL